MVDITLALAEIIPGEILLVSGSVSFHYDTYVCAYVMHMYSCMQQS